MALLVNDTYNGVADATAATAANTGATTVTGTGVIEYDTGNIMEGSSSLFMNAISNTRILRYDYASQAITRSSMYVYLNAAPAAASSPWQFRNAADTAVTAQMRFSTGGELQVRDGNTTQIGTTTGFAAATWHRVDWILNGTAGIQSVYIYKGTTIHSPKTRHAWASFSGALTETTTAAVQVGNVIAVAGGWTFSFDCLRVNDFKIPDPVAAFDLGRISSVSRRIIGIK